MMNKIIALICFFALAAANLYSQDFTVAEVFEAASKIDGFQQMDYIADDIKFPADFGKPTMIAHGNAEPREQVIQLLNNLPDDSLVYDNTDEDGKFDRLFLNKDTYDVLYVHLGFRGNDSVLILFKGGKREAVDSFIESLKQ